MSLPILSSRFFVKHRPDLGFFSKWQTLAPWSDQLVPIYEWEGILFVGCLQPPKNFPETNSKIVFVLCEHQALKEVWQELQEQVRKTSAHAMPSAPTGTSGLASAVGMKLKLPNTIPAAAREAIPATPAFVAPAPATSNHFASESLNLKSTKSPEIPTLPELPELPTLPELPELPQFPDLSAELPDLPEIPTLPELASVAVPKAAAAPTDPEALFPELKSIPKSIAPTGLSLEEEMAAAGASDEIEGLELKSEDEAEQKDEKSLEDELDQLLDLTLGTSTKSQIGGIPTMTMDPQTASMISASPLNPLPSLLLDQDHDSSSSITESLASEVPVNSDASITKSSTALTSEEKMRRARPTRSEPVRNFKDDVTHISIKALNSTPADTLDSLMEQIFEKMAGSYDKSMVLLKTGEEMKPWRWDESFQPASSDSRAVPLIKPSPFRIAMRTQKPYHGYVVANDINNEFFVDWNDSNTPEHLTVAPILVYDHVIGMLVGFGTKDSDTKEALDLAEMLAEQIAQKIKSSPDAMRAA